MVTPVARPVNVRVVMGVLNVTADSFSDGGRYLDSAAAVGRARELAANGADIIDVGGESTRPGAHRVPAPTEAERVVPVIAELARAGIVCSVDTTRATVAAAALAAGARMVNDVSGGLADPEMAAVVADAGVPWILMHWRGHSADMDALATYHDVVPQVRAELLDRVGAAVAAGVEESAIVLDPGLGFAKTAEHNWSLLRALPEMTGLTGPGWGFPVLIGASRKRFLGSLLADCGRAPSAGRPGGGDDRHLGTGGGRRRVGRSGTRGGRIPGRGAGGGGEHRTRAGPDSLAWPQPLAGPLMADRITLTGLVRLRSSRRLRSREA